MKVVTLRSAEVWLEHEASSQMLVALLVKYNEGFNIENFGKLYRFTTWGCS